MRLLILGAHPDDAEYHAGGLASMYRQLGHAVKMVSMTDGSAGHHTRRPGELAEIRRQEAEAAAAHIGAACEIWEYLDGHLLPTLSLRERVIREIRTFAPDLLLTHRTNDYHPDHRAAGQAVQDASFLVRVPLVVPDVPALPRDPVVAFLPDLFTKPCPLDADVVLDVDPQLDTIVSMLACHVSQVFQWLPYLAGTLKSVPEEPGHRREWLRDWYTAQIAPRADRYRKELIAAYGPEHGARVRCAEIFEISQYGSPLDQDRRQRLFPFWRDLP
jgi:LmbE family N-acetylglucosaminyl deacetylase